MSLLQRSLVLAITVGSSALNYDLPGGETDDGRMHCPVPLPEYGWPDNGPFAEEYPNLDALCIDNPEFLNLDCRCFGRPWNHQVLCNSADAAEELDDHLELIAWCEEFCHCPSQKSKSGFSGSSEALAGRVSPFLQSRQGLSSDVSKLFHFPKRLAKTRGGPAMAYCRDKAVAAEAFPGLPQLPRCHRRPSKM